MRNQSATLVAVAVCALLTLAGAAGAADGDPFLKSCFSTAAAAPCAALQPSFAAADAELAPGGGQLYVAVWPQGGGGYHGLRIFDVAGDGTLSVRTGAAATMAKAPSDVDFSADGRNAYVAAGDQLVVFQRDTTTGVLTQLQCFGVAPCSPVAGVNSFASAAVSPDGRNVYARGSNQLTVFDRDPGVGTLSQKPGLAGCVAEEVSSPCATAVGIAGSGLEAAVSSDNRHVYVTNEVPGGVAFFTRGASGALAQLPGTSGGCVTAGGSSGGTGGAECTNGSPTLAQARAVNLDAQGGFAIVSAAGGNTVFRRDAASGTLSQTDCVDEVGGSTPPADCHEVKGAAGSDAALTPDGRHVALNASELGLSSFRLDRATGKLVQRAARGCFSVVVSAPCEHVPGLHGGLGGLTFSPNGAALFATFRGGSVAAFDVDIAPACQKATVSVPRNATAHVPLKCTDVNGDAVTLEIASPPRNGALGIVDQRRKRVSYKPDINFKGRDVFQYRGTARGTRGTAATVTVTVLASGRRVDETPPNTKIKEAPPKTTSSGAARFRFASTERRSRFECALDEGRWTRCRSPKRYLGLERGRHTFRVRAIDRAGNFDLSPAKRSWIRRGR